MQEAGSKARGDTYQAEWQRALQHELRELIMSKLDVLTADYLLRADE